MVNIIICGAAGKMGDRILNIVLQDKELNLAGAVESRKHPMLGKKIGPVTITDDLDSIIKSTDVIIDFTCPVATIEHLKAAAYAGKAMVIGTTGFDHAQLISLKKIASQIPCVFSPNMSIGINVLFKIVHEVAGILSDYDIEIIEAHHNQKKDAPSGTAAKIAEIIAAVLGRDIDKVGVAGRKGMVGKRKKEEIGIHAVRAGDIVGEHTIIYAGHGERIELIHRAHSRDTFARGAVKAARWVVSKPKGLYSMHDVLGIDMPDYLWS